MRKSLITIALCFLASIFTYIIYAERIPGCPRCYKDVKTIPGHGQKSATDNRTVLWVKVDESWFQNDPQNPGKKMMNPKLANALQGHGICPPGTTRGGAACREGAIMLWNTRTSEAPNQGPYFLQIKQDYKPGEEPDMLITRVQDWDYEKKGGCAGYTYEEKRIPGSNPPRYEYSMKGVLELPATAVDWTEKDMEAIIAHEMGHGQGLSNTPSSPCQRSTMREITTRTGNVCSHPSSVWDTDKSAVAAHKSNFAQNCEDTLRRVPRASGGGPAPTPTPPTCHTDNQTYETRYEDETCFNEGCGDANFYRVEVFRITRRICDGVVVEQTVQFIGSYCTCSF
jgi:hypothetical protein